MNDLKQSKTSMNPSKFRSILPFVWVILIILTGIMVYIFRNQPSPVPVKERVMVESPGIKTPPQAIDWQQDGNTITFTDYNGVSLTLPNGWYWSSLRSEPGYPGETNFSAIASNYPNAEHYNLENQPKDFKFFSLSIWPAGTATKNIGVQQFSDKEETFQIENGSATLYQALVAKPVTQDMSLPAYFGLASDASTSSSEHYEVFLQHTTDGPPADSALRDAMVSLLKSVKFSQP